jgi:hypothetical protein
VTRVANANLVPESFISNIFGRVEPQNRSSFEGIYTRFRFEEAGTSVRP